MTQYRWRDLNRDGAYQAGEVYLNLDGSDFIAITGMSLCGLFVYKRAVDNYIGNFNTRRPFDVYNQQLTRRDPAPDGTLDTGVDAFNACNSNVAWGSFTNPGINDVSGPTLGDVTDIVPPRNVRFGASFEF